LQYLGWRARRDGHEREGGGISRSETVRRWGFVGRVAKIEAGGVSPATSGGTKQMCVRAPGRALTVWVVTLWSARKVVSLQCPTGEVCGSSSQLEIRDFFQQSWRIVTCTGDSWLQGTMVCCRFSYRFTESFTFHFLPYMSIISL
jgi:hypothetical protein